MKKKLSVLDVKNKSDHTKANMFLDENGVPFMGGTYFPKIDKHGLPAFKKILQTVANAYKDQRLKIIEQKNLIIRNLSLKKTNVISQEIEPILENLLNNLDEKNGGYKGAPKFPTFYISLAILFVLPTLTFLIGGVSLTFEIPELTQLSKTVYVYKGGVSIIPELIP